MGLLFCSFLPSLFFFPSVLFFSLFSDFYIAVACTTFPLIASINCLFHVRIKLLSLTLVKINWFPSLEGKTAIPGNEPALATQI